jgi:transcriptional regulator with XRE-family HTH domain
MANSTTRTAISTYKTYSFTDKDPAIDELRTLVQDSEMSYDDISEESGVSTSTLWNWFSGDTRRPHNASLEAVGRALGYRREFVFVGKAKAMKMKPKTTTKVAADKLKVAA